MKKDILTHTSIEVINSPSLTWAAKGMYIFMVHGFLYDEEITRPKLIEGSGNGRFATVSALRELTMAGLVERIVKRQSGSHKFERFYYKVK